MGLATRTGNSPQLLIGPSGSDPKFDDLVDGLERHGCTVTVFDDLPIEDPLPKRARALIVVTQRDTIDTPEGQRVQGLIREAGFVEGMLGRRQVVLLVDESAPRLSDTGLEQIRYPAGNLVHVLPDVLDHFGLVRHATTELTVVRNDDEPTERDLHRQVPIVEQFPDDDLRVPWILVALVLLVSGLAGLLVFRNLINGRGDDTVADGSSDQDLADGERVTLETLSSLLVNSGAVASPTATDRSSGPLSGAAVDADGTTGDLAGGSTTVTGEGSDELLAGSEIDAEGNVVSDGAGGAATDGGVSGGTGAADGGASGGTVVPPDPATSGGSTPTTARSSIAGSAVAPSTTAASAPATTPAPSSTTTSRTRTSMVHGTVMQIPPAPSGSGTGLPSTCYIDLRKGEILPQDIVCDGAGQVVVAGWAGPWHNDIWALAVSQGVTGTLIHEVRPDGTTVGPTERELAPGVIYLNEDDADYGTQMLRLVFGGDQQHVHLYQHPDEGGEEAILIFVLAPK